MTSLSGKTALITGATGGMGKEISLCLAKENVNLILLGRDTTKLKKLRDKIYNIAKVHIDLFKLDLGGDIAQDIQDLVSFEKKIDILVYTAGSIIPNNIEGVEINEFSEQFNVNFRSAYVLVRAMLPQLKKSRGQIILINSSIIRNTKTNLSVYTASKYALLGFTESLRQEVNPSGIRVVNIVPGKTATGMQEKLALSMNTEMKEELMIQPNDIAYTVLQVLRLPYTAEITDLFIRPMRK